MKAKPPVKLANQPINFNWQILPVKFLNSPVKW